MRTIEVPKDKVQEVKDARLRAVEVFKSAKDITTNAYIDFWKQIYNIVPEIRGKNVSINDNCTEIVIDDDPLGNLVGVCLNYLNSNNKQEEEEE